MSRMFWAAAALAVFTATGAGYATQAHADAIPAAHPVASPMEDQAAMAAFNSQFGTATAVGGVVGTIVVGGPALALAGTDLVGTLTAAPGTSKWAR